MTFQPIDIPRCPAGARFDVQAVVGGRFAVSASGDRAIIDIIDVIGLDVTEARIVSALRDIGAKPLTVRINSPGGDYYQGLAIYNRLGEHAIVTRQPLTVQVMGLAASAASLIAMAGDRIELAQAAEIMIHNPRMVAYGDSEAMIAATRFLEKTNELMAQVYASRSGQAVSTVLRMMADETYMSGDDAIALGFATDASPMSALPVPQALKASVQNRRDLEDRLRRAGLTKPDASRVAAAGWPALAHPPSQTIDLSAVAECFRTNATALRAALKTERT